MVTPEELAAAGLYDPEAPGADDRLAALRYLLDHGCRLEHLLAAQQRGRLWAALTLSTLWPDGELLTIGEVAEASGLPEERVRLLRMVAGLPDPGDAADCPPEEIRVWQALAVGDQLFGTEGMLHVVRALGGAAATVAEAAMVLARPLTAKLAESELAYVQAAHQAAGALTVLPGVLDVLFRLHVTAAGDRLMRYDELTDELPRFAIGFVDLVSSTERTAELPPEELAGVVADFARIATEAAGRHGTRLVKLIGDEGMFADRDGAKVVAAVQEVVREVGHHPSLGRARAGVATGPVLPSEGDYFGPGANLASRVVAEAAADEVLVDEDTAQAVGLHDTGFREVTLRGFGGTHRLHSLP